jgi:hypothetical protein
VVVAEPGPARVEEIYVVLSGNGRIKVDEDCFELQPFDAVRVAPGSAREMQAGRDGLEVLAFGSHVSSCCRSRRCCARGRTGSVPASSTSASLRYGCWSSGPRGPWRRHSGSRPSTTYSRTEVVKGSRLSPGLRLAWSTRLSGPSGGIDQGAQATGPGRGIPRGGAPPRRR